MGGSLSCERCHAEDKSTGLVSGASEIQQTNDPINFDISQPEIKEEDGPIDAPSKVPPSVIDLSVEDLLLDEHFSDNEDGGAGLESGCKVRIVGMTSAAHLNGKLAVLQEFDATKQRWTIWLESESKQISAKPANLAVCLEGETESTTPAKKEIAGPGGFEVGQHVRILAMKTATELNGQTGDLLSFDPAKGRWTVELTGDARHIAVQPGNLELHQRAASPQKTKGEEHDPGAFKVGDYVEVVDMQTTELNGEVGGLVSFDASNGRWTVMLAMDARQIAAKPKNLKPSTKPKTISKGTKKNGKAAPPTDDVRQKTYEGFGQTMEENGCNQQ